MIKTTPEQNKTLVLQAFDTLFNKRDYKAAERYWSSNYIQHSAHIAPGRDGLFNLVRSTPPTLKYEPGLFSTFRSRAAKQHGPARHVVASVPAIGRTRLRLPWPVPWLGAAIGLCLRRRARPQPRRMLSACSVVRQFEFAGLDSGKTGR
jgi:hypothetical protein